jgi:hypothetical protein
VPSAAALTGAIAQRLIRTRQRARATSDADLQRTLDAMADRLDRLETALAECRQ